MDQQSKEQLNIREMTKEDVPQVFDLERRSFNDSSWTIDALHYEIEQNNFAKYFLVRNSRINYWLFRFMDCYRSSSNYNS